ncbi:MAG: hypothetical protein JW881_19475 [Spirochaetales bacterium]|nr:hypothetical protein [Spirochaetales bacterium]
MEFSSSFVDSMLDEGNYLAAYLHIKESAPGKEKEIEYKGKCVMRILDELTVSERRRNREKLHYYRSLLLLIFQDVPALARFYRGQLRSLRDAQNPLDFLRDLKEIAEATGNREEFERRVEDTIEDIKDRMEDTADSIRDGSAQESLENLVNIAGDGIKEGLKGFSRFLNDFTKTVREESEKRRGLVENEKRIKPAGEKNDTASAMENEKSRKDPGPSEEKPDEGDGTEKDAG